MEKLVRNITFKNLMGLAEFVVYCLELSLVEMCGLAAAGT